MFIRKREFIKSSLLNLFFFFFFKLNLKDKNIKNNKVLNNLIFF